MKLQTMPAQYVTFRCRDCKIYLAPAGTWDGGLIMGHSFNCNDINYLKINMIYDLQNLKKPTSISQLQGM
jgi:hypothetical protein